VLECFESSISESKSYPFHKLKHSNLSKIWCKSALNLASWNPSTTLAHNQTFKHKQNLALEKTYLVAECSHNLEVKASPQPPNVFPLYLTPSPLPSRSRAESSLATPIPMPSHRLPYPLGGFHNKTKSGPLQTNHTFNYQIISSFIHEAQ
jgi:hypothetical protein